MADRMAPRDPWIHTVALAVCALAISGCWPFNRTTPQQKYFNALKAGNSAEASQLWLQMSPDQRAEFERGEGIQPNAVHNDVQQAIDEHYIEQEDDGAAPKQVRLVPNAGLQNLPSYLKTNGATGAPQPAPPEQ